MIIMTAPRRRSRTFYLLNVLALLFGTLLSAQAADPALDVALVTAAGQVQPGESFTVTLIVHRASEAPAPVDVDLQLDPALELVSLPDRCKPTTCHAAVSADHPAAIPLTLRVRDGPWCAARFAIRATATGSTGNAATDTALVGNGEKRCVLALPWVSAED